MRGLNGIVKKKFTTSVYTKHINTSSRMKIIIRTNREDTSKDMLEFTGLCVTRKELKYNNGTTYGYAVVLCYPGEIKIWYSKDFTAYNHLNSTSKAKEACNKYLDEVIQKIQDAVNKAKKRHSEFTEIIELD